MNKSDKSFFIATIIAGGLAFFVLLPINLFLNTGQIEQCWSTEESQAKAEGCQYIKAQIMECPDHAFVVGFDNKTMQMLCSDGSYAVESST